ncbi:MULTISPECIES: hypothetical protein [Meiothermus]|jgi:hypothetical protein|uniref:Uncharacterized protein n=2 Tax=Meiothermus TaxID=65551 RepID=D3PMW9_MEIRD|nr:MULTISPECIES: hypothetical protein [Meiothermus]ADD27294.1 hypothetical protein Mrub_0519 [Meiothermus ruber DSM 1279]AGK03748.1 hypothetical protein K649_02220 [Meiothermus ruber DSM 1279]GEM83141.1 hypothetical protein MHY01S_13070 [Meiothermus hypogaeus NBRC 106114]
MRRLFLNLLFLLPGMGLAQNYYIDLSPTPVSVAPGKSAKSTLAVLSEGFTGTLAIGITGLPAGVTYSPTSITVSDPRKNATVEVVFTAAANTPSGSSPARLTVGAKTIFFSVVVDPAAEPPSQNPPALEALWNQVQQWGSTACATVNAFSLESVRWVCTLYRTLDRAVGMWDEVRQDFDMLKREGFITGVSYLVNGLGAEMGLARGNVEADQLEQDFLAIRRSYRQMVAKVSNWMTRVREKQVDAIRNNPYPNGSPSWWAVEAIKLNPNLLMAELGSLQRKEQLLQLRTKVEANNAAAEKQVEAATNQTQDDLAKALQVTNPLPSQEGEAEQVVRRAREANSTREVLEILVDAQAKIMRQNLTNTQDVVGAVRQSAAQQAYTTRQIANLIEIELERRADEIESWKAEVERTMAQVSEEAESQTANLRMLATLSRTVACPDGVLGPGADGNITCLRP